jgi:hypothetical protein
MMLIWIVRKVIVARRLKRLSNSSRNCGADVVVFRVNAPLKVLTKTPFVSASSPKKSRISCCRLH